MRARRKVCAADAGEQLPLLDGSGARSASSGPGRRRKPRADETSTTQSGTDEDCLADFVIFLWFLSNVPGPGMAWTPAEFTVEAAAEHHALWCDFIGWDPYSSENAGVG
jgi:hypothetical protein